MSGLAVLCSGQGGQHARMFDLVAGHPQAQAVLHCATELLGRDAASIARDSAASFRNREAQVLICSRALAAWSVLSPSLPRPRVFAGYSIGELCAYGCAGALTIEDTLSLAQQRATAMDQASDMASGLVAVRGLDSARIEALCRAADASIAIVNGPDHYIIGAQNTRLDMLEAGAREAGARIVRRLPVAIAAHTPWLASASTQFRTGLMQAKWAPPLAPVLAGIDGACVRESRTAQTVLAKQLSTTINWSACIDAMREQGADVFLELGPGNALTHMVRDRFPDATARSLEDFRSLAGVQSWIARTLS